MNYRIFAALSVFVCLFMGACTSPEMERPHDHTLNLAQKDYEDKLTGHKGPDPHTLPPVRKPPSKPVIPKSFLFPVTVSVTEGLPLKNVFMEIARQASANISINPKIEGSLYFQAHKEPFINVVKSLCKAAGFRYSIEGDRIRIDPDVPYWKEYDVQYLVHSRSHKNRVSAATDIFSVIEGHNNGLDNGSSTILSGQADINFWDELEGNIKRMVKQAASPDDQNKFQFSLHKQAGLISIFAPQSLHHVIESYLDKIKKRTRSQVLIEAKIVEVDLSDEFKSGINWHVLASDFALSAPLGDLSTLGPFNSLTTPARNVIQLGAGSANLTSLANVLSRFGTVRTLSSPRLTVMNNQSAILKVATNQVFFRIEYHREIGENNKPDVERAESQIQTVPIGLVMVVHPTIDHKTGQIIMSLRPTITRVVSTKEDPAVAILSKQEKISEIPEVQVREMDSVLCADSGGTLIMGGMMEERSRNETTGVPGAKDIPVLGFLFGGQSQERTVTELVVILRATIVEGEHTAAADQAIYKNFTKDPRPLHF